ncbi:MAG: protein kinase, partial [Ktedonobacteraceae bacterium]
MSDRVGQQLGNYRLVRLLGQGGFADVYLGEHIYLKTPAAIKVLQTRLVQDDLQVFLKEARSIANLVHPNIVRVLEFGVEGDLPFLVMDHAANGTLRQRHPKGTQVPPPVVAAYIKQVASALQYAHEQRLIHRDIKPENMLLGRNNEVLLSDFGIAVVAQSSRYQQSNQDVGGTIAYMAPEQLQGRAVPASDQYALGIVVYEWLCGERPFQGSFPEIASQHMLATPTPLRSRVPGLSPAIEEVVQRALAKDPQQRFMKVQAFAQTLEQAAQPGQYSQSQPTYVPPPPPRMGAAPSGSPSGGYGTVPSGSPSGDYGTTQPQQGTPSGTYGANPFGQTAPNRDPSRQGMPSGMYGNVPPAQTTPSGNFGAVPPGQMTPNFGSMQQGTPTGNFTNYPGQSGPNYAAFPSGPQAPNPNSTMPPGQFAQMAPGSNQPKKMISRRTAMLGIAGLVVVIGGGSVLALSQKHGNGPTLIAGASTPANNTPVNTPVTAPTDTPTSLPTDTPTTDPNVT